MSAPNTPSVLRKAGTRAVWKFSVSMPSNTGRSFIDLPLNAELLSAGMQGDEMFVWALVDPDQEQQEMRRLIVANTGMDVPGFPADAQFLGTFTTFNGIVWHVWDGDA